MAEADASRAGPVPGHQDRPPVPARYLDEALVTGNGDLLWPATTVGEVIEWARAAGLAVLAGETYGREGPMRTNFRSDWEVSPAWSASEPWAVYVMRAADQANAAVVATTRQHGVRNVTYYLALTREHEYPFPRVV